jgi:hypothetical protein
MLDAFTARKANAGQPAAATPEQQSPTSRFLQGAGEEVKGIAAPIIGAVQQPQDHKEELTTAIGGPGALLAYRAAKKLIDSTEGLLTAKKGQYENLKQDLINAATELHSGNWRSGLASTGSTMADVGELTGSPIAGRMREFTEGSKPEGDLAGPLGKTAVDVAALGLGKGIGGAVEGEEAAAGEAASKPGLIKQVIKGEKVAQVPARQALESGAKASAEDAGVAASETAGKGIRTLLDEPIKSAAKAERATYDTVNKAAETDMKSLFDRKEELEDALDDPTNIANRQALSKELSATEKAIKVHSDLAASKGVTTADAIKQAEGMTKQRYAMENLKQKLFNNEGIVEGNLAHGVEETINVKAAIREVEKLDKPSRFAPEGSPSRLQQALGEKGATELKQALYDAKKAGQSALTKQRIAKLVGGLIGVGSAQGIIREVMH